MQENTNKKEEKIIKKEDIENLKKLIETIILIYFLDKYLYKTKTKKQKQKKEKYIVTGKEV